MYSVFINKRPIRFVFLVDPQKEDWPDQLDAIWNYNLDKWGGRFNPIIPTNGSEISPDWWPFFKKLDPDYVIATSTISDELRDQIKADICPIDVELPRPNQRADEKPNIFTYNDTISVAPISQTLAKLSTNFLSLPPLPQMANLTCDYTADDIVRRFVIRNFGSYPNIVYWNGVLDKIAHLDFPLATKENLVRALTELSRPELKIVYPIQVSSLDGPALHLDYEHEHSYDAFGLIVGDTFEDQLFSWNKVFYGRTENQSHRLNHLWLPTAFASDAELMETLGRWLRRMTERVHLFSFSVSQDDLSAMGESLDATRESGFVLRSALHKSVTALASFPFPKFAQAHTFSFWDRFSYALSPPKDADHYRASALNEEFEISGPAMGQELRPRGSWIADVFIEADKNRFYDEKIYLRQDSPFWWQLPRKNYLATQIFGVQARINSRGVPAIQLPAKNPRLRFQLPDERQLLRSCVLGDVYGRMSGQVKRRSLDIDEVDPSNIGKYLSGFLEVFGGLAAAHSVLSERYWRTVFDVLSGRDSAKDSNLLEQVSGKLRKKIASYLTKTEMLNNFENLAEYVIQLSREVGSEGAAKEFSTFQEEARKEHGEFQQEEGVDWEFDENAVRNNMSRLLEIGVLQMGCNQRCPRCGTVTWFLVDEVRQSVVCAGCRYVFAILAEPTLSYRLSTLARQGIFAHGLVPVVLVLGQLLTDSRSSFFLSPSLDLFKLKSDEPRRYQRLTDLDVVCIKDGKFVIGEIKTNQARFELEQSLKMADIAEAIGADILLFSSLETEQTNETKEMIGKVKERLTSSKVEVGWYQLAEIFRPSRMDY